MFLNKRSNGFYYVHYCDETGKWKSVSTRTKLKPSANQFFSNLKSNLLAVPKSMRLSEYKAKYLTFSRTNHSSNSTVRIKFVLNHFIEFAGDPLLSGVTAQSIESYKAKRLGKVSPVTVNIELRTLKAFFGTAAKWGLLNNTPFKNVRMVRVPEQFPLYVKQNEIAKLLDAISLRWLRDLVVFALNTGLRRNELVNLKWEDVEFNQSLLTIRNTVAFRTKDRADRAIPLNTQALKILSERSKASAFIFTNTKGEALRDRYVSECFRLAVEKAELNPKLHFHSLRHSFASYLVQNGAPIYEVQRLLGHSNITITQVYSHLSMETLHSTVRRLSLPTN